MQAMVIKGHFDGRVVVLDEPAALAVGQCVEVTVHGREAQGGREKRRALVGFAKGIFEMGADFNDPLPEFAEYR